MDKGEWLRRGFHIAAARDGSYVIYQQSLSMGDAGSSRGFSNVDDLVDFVKSERKSMRKQDASETNESIE